MSVGRKRAGERWALGCLCVLCAALPFEARVGRVGPLELSTVELALYAALAAWVASVFASGSLRAQLRALREEPLAPAVLLGYLALVLCAALAPSHRGAAVKFALRSGGGVGLFFASRALLRGGRAWALAGGSLLAGSLLSAAGAWAELLAPRTASWWSAFRERASFSELELARASSSFVYPTVGAMDWEASLPLLVGAAACAWQRGSRRAAWLLLGAGSALLGGALAASGTRSGVAGALLVLGALSWAREARVRALSRGALLGLGAAVLAVVLAGGALRGERFLWWRDGRWLRASYEVPQGGLAVRAGERFRVRVRVRNEGTRAWPREGPRPVHLAYHWVPTAGVLRRGDYEGLRTELPRDVAPGEGVALEAEVRAPAWQGEATLQWDLVQERVAWFSDRGVSPGVQRARILEAEVPQEAPREERAAPHARDEVQAPPPGRFVLWRAAVTLWRARPLLGVGPDNYRRRYPEALARASAGQRYGDERLHANSWYLETLADQGLLGLAALAALLLAWARASRGAWLRSDARGLAAAGAAGAFFVHGVTDWFAEFTATYALFALALGGLAARELAALKGADGGPRGTAP